MRRPRITVPVVNIPRPGPVVERPAPSASAKTKARRAVKRIRTRLRSADAHFYAVGKELRSLDRAAVVAAYGAASFDAFLDAHVMPHSTAKKYMAVADEYPEVLALRLGVEKAFHLTIYAKRAGTRLRARELARLDKTIGSPRRRVSTFTAAEIESMAQMLKVNAAREALPKATRAETRAAKSAARAVEDVLGVDARVRVDKKRDLVRLEIRLSDLLDA